MARAVRMTEVIVPEFKPTDEQLRISYALIPRAALIRETRAKLYEIENALLKAKEGYKQLVSSLTEVPISDLKFTNDPCLNEVASFHVYRLDDDAHPCVFCSIFEPDEDNL